MVTRVRYVNKITRETAPTLEQWIESISDITDKQSVQNVYNTELQRDTGLPANEYIELFDRYMRECDIEIIRTDE